MVNIPKTEDLTIKIDGRVAIASLNREEKLNALRKNTFEELMRVAEWADKTEEIGVLLIKGNGRAFCAGADLNEYSRIDTVEEARASQRRGREALESLARIGKPVVASVHGYAVGGGMALALCCDVIFSEEDAKFSLPEVKRGFFPGMGITSKMPFITSPYVAKDLMFSGRMVSARELQTYGIVSKVLPADELAEVSLEYAKNIAEMPPDALSAMKEIVNRTMLDNGEKLYEDELNRHSQLFISKETKENFNRFLNKKK